MGQAFSGRPRCLRPHRRTERNQAIESPRHSHLTLPKRTLGPKRTNGRNWPRNSAPCRRRRGTTHRRQPPRVPLPVLPPHRTSRPLSPRKLMRPRLPRRFRIGSPARTVRRRRFLAKSKLKGRRRTRPLIAAVRLSRQPPDRKRERTKRREAGASGDGGGGGGARGGMNPPRKPLPAVARLPPQQTFP